MWRCLWLSVALMGGTACGFMPAGPGAAGACDSDDEDCGRPLAFVGTSEASFMEQFVDAYCDAWESCNTAGEPCPISLADIADTVPADCTFDAEQASDCLGAEYECDDSFGPGAEYPVLPTSCEHVYDCPKDTGSSYGYYYTTDASP